MRAITSSKCVDLRIAYIDIVGSSCMDGNRTSQKIIISRFYAMFDTESNCL